LSFLSGFHDELATPATQGRSMPLTAGVVQRTGQLLPVMNALAILEGAGRRRAPEGSSVIVAGFSPALGYGIRVPRYGEITRAQVTALAAETIL
jgi:hypothetical protein